MLIISDQHNLDMMACLLGNMPLDCCRIPEYIEVKENSNQFKPVASSTLLHANFNNGTLDTEIPHKSFYIILNI